MLLGVFFSATSCLGGGGGVEFSCVAVAELLCVFLFGFWGLGGAVLDREFGGFLAAWFEMGILSLITGKAGASGFGSGSTAEQVTAGVDATGLTVIVTGKRQSCLLPYLRILEFISLQCVVVASKNLFLKTSMQFIFNGFG